MASKAVVYVSEGVATVQDVSVPELRPDTVLVKVTAVAINPTDWKHVYKGFSKEGCISGCDYAGVVEQVGSEVKRPFKKGDRISGLVHGANVLDPQSGSFTNYLLAKGDVQIRTPDNLSDEDAATLGVSVATVGQGLYRTLGLTLPDPDRDAPSNDQFLLIHGGSTATGIYGIQFAKLSGCRVIVTASPHNFGYLKSLGAEAAFDYKSATVASDIRAYTNNSLKSAWDCTGTGIPLCASALSSEGGRYASITRAGDNDDLLHSVNPNVDGPHRTLGYETLGERIIINGKETLAKPEEFEFAREFTELARKLLAAGKVKPPRTIINRGGPGLEGVLKGLVELKDGNVSAAKLVYTL